MKARTIVGSIALAAGALCIPAAATPAIATAATTAASANMPVVHVHGDLHVASIARVPQTHLPRFTRPGGLSNTVYKSTNWSGYAAVAARGVKLTAVQAEFTVPSINCASAPSGAAETEWVGLDGVTNKSVEQEGVLGYCDPTTDLPTYYAWYEMYPRSARAYTGAINPGDEIVVNTRKYKTGNTFALSLTDVTTRAGFSVAPTCPTSVRCLADSAEVILEAPFNGTTNAQSPLADFGAINFASSKLSVNQRAKATFSSRSRSYSLRQIDMVTSAGKAAATASGLFGGTDFTDTWHRFG